MDLFEVQNHLQFGMQRVLSSIMIRGGVLDVDLDYYFVLFFIMVDVCWCHICSR